MVSSFLIYVSWRIMTTQLKTVSKCQNGGRTAFRWHKPLQLCHSTTVSIQLILITFGLGITSRLGLVPCTQHRLNFCVWTCRGIVQNSLCSVLSWLVCQYVKAVWKLSLYGLYIPGLCCSAFSILSPVFCQNTKST